MKENSSFLWVVGAVTMMTALAAWFSLFSDESPAAKVVSIEKAPEHGPHFTKAIPHATLVERSCDDKGAAPLTSVQLRQVLLPSPKLESLSELAFRAPQEVRAKASEGDALAAVAFFKMALSCAFGPNEATGKPTSDGCSSGITRSEAFSILEKAAESGNVEAQTTFALNALPYANSLQRKATNEAMAEAVRLRKQSEFYGAAAAKSGSAEAMSFMARSYLTGMFGARDVEKGYLYLLPLSEQDHSQPVTELMQSVSRNLSPAAKANAQMAAFGCGPDPALLVNPFKSQ